MHRLNAWLDSSTDNPERCRLKAVDADVSGVYAGPGGLAPEFGWRRIIKILFLQDQHRHKIKARPDVYMIYCAAQGARHACMAHNLSLGIGLQYSDFSFLFDCAHTAVVSTMGMVQFLGCCTIAAGHHVSPCSGSGLDTSLPHES